MKNILNNKGVHTMKRIVTLLLAVILMLGVCMPVAAVASPTPVEYYSIQVGLQGKGYVETDKTGVQAESDEVVTLWAREFLNEDTGQVEIPFIRWDITGSYNIVEGDLNSTILKIIPYSDIVATAIFTGGENQTPTFTDRSATSPKTGQNPLPVYIALALLVAGATGVMIGTKGLKRKY